MNVTVINIIHVTTRGGATLLLGGGHFFFLSPTTILVIGYSPTKKLEPAPPIISKISS